MVLAFAKDLVLKPKEQIIGKDKLHPYVQVAFRVLKQQVFNGLFEGPTCSSIRTVHICWFVTHWEEGQLKRYPGLTIAMQTFSCRCVATKRFAELNKDILYKPCTSSVLAAMNFNDANGLGKVTKHMPSPRVSQDDGGRSLFSRSAKILRTCPGFRPCWNGSICIASSLLANFCVETTSFASACVISQEGHESGGKVEIDVTTLPTWIFQHGDKTVMPSWGTIQQCCLDNFHSSCMAVAGYTAEFHSSSWGIGSQVSERHWLF